MSKVLSKETSPYFKTMSGLILNQKETLAKTILDEERFDYSHLGNNRSRLEHLRMKLIHLYGETVSLPPAVSVERLKEWGAEYADIFVSLNIPLDRAIEEVHFYRTKIGIIIKEEAKMQKLDLDTFYELISEFDSVVDTVVLMVSTSYMEKHASNLETAGHEIDELSVPVVPLGDGVGILPMIGDIDTNRAQVLMENALRSSVDLKLDTLFWIYLEYQSLIRWSRKKSIRSFKHSN
ncbi:rsbT co-antagonist protein RsbR [Bacillus sp. OV194]|nr:rsbT co-antagonist protein RsbR [Bacillus sp. OV194]